MNIPEKKDEKIEILSLKGVNKYFGGVTALDDVSFSVPRGIVQGLIGPNGAGKTTLFNVISGSFPPDKGEVWFDGACVNGFSVHRVVKKGIARTFQNVELFESMTVLENVMVGLHAKTKSGFFGAVTRLPGVLREERFIKERALTLLEFVGLANDADQRSGDMPFGWQRLLEIARALASSPKLLLLDEPAAGLNAVETRKLGDLIRQIQEQSITVILVEHDMSLTMKVSDAIVVLDQGRVLAQGTPREIQANEAVTAAYLGKTS